jgi:AcrR family transcriptional regulator
MTGLRAKHREDRNQRILKAATSLFRSVGFEAARIERIAAKADVSIGTIYNYYRNKGDILVAIVSMEVNEVLGVGEGIIKRPPKNVAKAVDMLITTYFDHSLVYLDKDMWRQSMATSTQQPNSPFGKTYSALDMALADQICSLISVLKKLGLVQEGVDTRGVGEMLFNNQNMMFIDFVKNDDMTLKQLCTRIRRQNKTLLKAITRG